MKQQELFNIIQNTPTQQPLYDAEEKQNVDLSVEFWKRTVAERVKLAIDEHSMQSAGDGFRSHLGWSVIEHECMRYLYYHWRWFWKEEHHARMERIFLAGHKVEAEFRVILKSLGAVFLDDVDATGEQIAVSELWGHFGGSCDGVFIWPEIGINVPTVLECKSSGTGAKFNDLSKKSLAAANRRHYIQGSGYARGLGIKYFLYVCRNKNDSSIYVELVEADYQAAEDAVNKAKHIVGNTVLPKRISEKRNFFVCNMCAIQPLCHDRKEPVPNCRNCKSAMPGENASWFCSKWNSVIPNEAIINGCNQHQFLNW